MDQKITVLRAILEGKHILFGGFSSNLSEQDKRKKWEEIATICHSLGVIPSSKDFTYVRDAYWPNMKKATMAKIDNAKKTGSAGGKNKELTAVDELVLEILGKNSPTVAGLGATDIMREEIEQQPISLDETSVDRPEISASLPVEMNNYNSSKTCKNAPKTIVMEGSRKHAELLEVNTLKKRKLEAEIENIKLQNYKLQLDIYEREKRLNIKTHQSMYTKDLIIDDPFLPQVDNNVLLIHKTCVLNEDGTVTEETV